MTRADRYSGAMKPPHGNRPPGGSRNDPPRGGSRNESPRGGGDRPRGPSSGPGGGSPRGRSEGPRGERPRPEGQTYQKRPAAAGPARPRPEGPARSRQDGDERRPRPEGYTPRPRAEGDDRRPRPAGFSPRPRSDGAPTRDGAPARDRGTRDAAPPRASDNPRARFDGGAPRPRITDETARARREEGFGPHGGAPRGPRPGAPAPHGTLWIYGTHAVAAALANPSRLLRRLILTEEAEAALREKLPGAWPLQPERSERARMDQLLGTDVVHQGAALLADPLGTPSMEKLLERPGPVLVLDQVSDPRNVGAILRSAAAFGAAGVIVQDRNAPEETGALAKAASGALETVPLLRAVNLSRTLVALKAAGCWVVGLDAGGAALSGASLAERRVVLVVGAEGNGLRRLTRETCDEIAGLAMPGGMESLNVSAATAIALYELARR
jgi:23S rRNA (guanosine2251-2'-O)-methyltransferase